MGYWRPHSKLYTVSQKSPPFYFSNNCQKLTDLNDFGALNPEKIWHHIACTLLTSPVYWCHFTLRNPKKSFFNSIIYTYWRLFTLSQNETNCYSLTHHTWKMSPHYLLKCTNFSSFSLFARVLSTNERYGRVAEASCCDMGWILAERGERCSWLVAKKTMEVCIRAEGGHFVHLL